MKSDSMLTD